MTNDVKIILCDLILESLQSDDDWEDKVIQRLAKKKLDWTMEETGEKIGSHSVWRLVPEIKRCLDLTLETAREKIETLAEQLENE